MVTIREYSAGKDINTHTTKDLHKNYHIVTHLYSEDTKQHIWEL